MHPTYKRAGNSDGKRNPSIAFIAAALRVLTALLMAQTLTSCDTWPASSLKIPQVSKEAYREYKLDIDDKKNVIEKSCVVIDGQDIQLPLSSGKSRPQENRTYSFYVWAYDPDSTQPLYDLWHKGAFEVDVVGAKATIEIPDYLPNATAPPNLSRPATNADPAAATNPLKSREALEVKIRSEDISGPFTIVAWFPAKYAQFVRDNYTDTNIFSHTNLNGTPIEAASRKNPWGEKRDVKVYNGDLRTHVEIIDDRQAQSSFGKPFCKFFYVGRVYLRNRHTDKSMVVYTTSLQANVLLYRPPTEETLNTLSSSRGSPSMMPEPMIGNQFLLKTNEMDFLRKRLTNNFKEARTNEWEHISPGERAKLIDEARRQGPGVLGRRGYLTNLGATEAAKIVRQIIPKKAEPQKKNAMTGITNFWFHVYQSVHQLNKEQEQNEQEGNRLAKEQIQAAQTEPFLPLIVLGKGADRKNAARKEITQGFERMKKSGPGLKAVYESLTNQIAQACLAPDDVRRWTTNAAAAYEDFYRARRAQALGSALKKNLPESLESRDNDPVLRGLRDEYDARMAEIESSAFGAVERGLSANPFDSQRDIRVNPAGRALAFSEDSDREVHLNQVGYLWHESVRPMTFQAVLNSLMYTQDNSWSAKTMKLLESAATVAGGLVGMGAFIHEFRSDAYVTTVGIVSTIFFPEIGKLVLEDLNKHIRNLGEMGMDTVVVVPPNSVVDRYIFFPKGPIFNFPDEFDVNTPAYIKRIDNDDVSVEATLIDAGVQVQGGGMSSTALVERALNEGQADENADLAKQTELQENLRSLELKNLTKQIQTILAGAPLGTNNVKDAKRVQAEAQVCTLVQRFEKQWGTDSSGALAMLLAQNQVNCDTPPTVQPAAKPAVNLLGGVISKSFVLPVTDVMGVWTLKITNTTTDASILPSSNVVTTLPGQGADGPAQFTALALPNAAQAGDATSSITFLITNATGQATNLVVPVTVHNPKFSFNVLSGAAFGGGAFTLGDANALAFVEALLPIYDSDPKNLTNWSFTVQSSDTNTPSWTIYANSAPTMAAAGGINHVTSGWVIDGSQATNTSVSAKLTFLYGTNVMATTNITAKLNNP